MRSILQIPDSMAHDTGYKIGYYVGAWLPFIFLVLLTILVVWLIKRKK